MQSLPTVPPSVDWDSDAWACGEERAWAVAFAVPPLKVLGDVPGRRFRPISTYEQKKDLNTVRDWIWRLYEGLKRYKENPRPTTRKGLETEFDKIFTMKTRSATLNQALKRLYNNKPELLLVLDRPDIPIHNHAAENAIREYVKKRKISGSTRSEAGRKCRDTFTSLKKTCRKLRISFWDYLKDRIEKIGLIPNLPDLIREQSMQPG